MNRSPGDHRRNKLGVLVSWGCPNKDHTGWLKQQKFIISQFSRLEIQDQGVGGVGYFWGLRGKKLFQAPPSFW